MKPIFLVGMPGSGKSTIGKELAKKMELDFLDTDNEITRISGRTPEQIIEEEGEGRLRVLESEFLNQMIESKNILIIMLGDCIFHKMMNM